MDNLCAVCPRPGKLCSGCKNIRYCSHAHQKQDWEMHYTVCKQFSELGDRPSPDMRRVIYFDARFGKHPQFKWLPLKFGEDFEEPDFQSENLLGSGDLTWTRIDFKKNSVNDKELRHTIFLMVVDNYHQSGAEFNESVYYLTKGATTTLMGPIIAYGALEPDFDDEDTDEFEIDKCTDLDTTDLKAIVNYLQGKQNPGRENIVVKLNCNGRIQKPLIEQIKLINFDPCPFFSGVKLHFSTLSKFLGIPLLLFATSTESGIDVTNLAADLLMIPCEKSAKNWGKVMSEWRESEGNMVVMRRDGRFLDYMYLRLIIIWIKNDLVPLFDAARGECQVEVNKAKDDKNYSGEAVRKIRETREKMTFDHITMNRFEDYTGEIPEGIQEYIATDDEMPHDHKESEESDENDESEDNDESDEDDRDEAHHNDNEK
ncbi:hypothetical protein KCU98_g6698, partial [Aureobasidium melanogenum]